MSGKQAKILSAAHIDELLFFADTTRHPVRNRVLILLSIKAGLRAAEIANLTWEMVLTPGREIGMVIELRDHAAKMGHGRHIPIHADLRTALAALKDKSSISGNVVKSERGGAMTPLSIVVWFARAYRTLGLDGCSSQSRRILAGRSASGWSPINPNHPTLH
jgi:integrase/recombinase XerD